MWFHAYICRAVELGIAKGFSDGKFGPNDTVTTLEALAFGFRAFNIPLPATGSGELWYEPMVRFADENNIIPRHEYTLGTKISRGKATELITKIRAYNMKRSPLSYKSNGCIVGKDL
jgi:S-layer homology domain